MVADAAEARSLERRFCLSRRSAGGVSRRLPDDWRDQPIAALADRFDVRGIRRVVAERAPQLANRAMQHIVCDEDAGPDPRDQLFARHHLAGVSASASSTCITFGSRRTSSPPRVRRLSDGCTCHSPTRNEVTASRIAEVRSRSHFRMIGTSPRPRCDECATERQSSADHRRNHRRGIGTNASPPAY